MSKTSAAVSKDRTIQTFALPYDPVSSPYKKVAFDERVKKFCTETSPSNARVCKIVVVGEVGVGKTCLVNRFCHNAFETDYKATIGVDFEVEKFQVLGVPFNFNMWDTAGQERFHCIAESYFRSSQVIILTFEFGNMKSLERCTFWKESACKCSDDPLIFLVGTKRDLMDDRVYKEFEQDALQVARDLNAEYWPTSSKTGLNVKDAFFRIACLAFDKIISQELEAKTTTQPRKAAGSFTMTRKDHDMYEKAKKKKGCC